MLLREFKGILLCIFAVEAYTASWIEITLTIVTGISPLSRLIQPRGLKCSEDAGRINGGIVEAYTALQIEILYRSF